jgi:hypothetical protein
MKEYYLRVLEEMAKHVNERDGKIRSILSATSLLLKINEHKEVSCNHIPYHQPK